MKDIGNKSQNGRQENRPSWQQVANKIVQWEPWLLALAAPFLLFPNRATPAAFVLILLPWAGRRLTTGRFSRPTPFDLPIALLLMMALVGFCVSVDPTMSRAKLWGIILQTAVFYGVVNNVHRITDARRLAALLILLTAVVALLSLVGSDWDNVRLLDLPQIYEHLPRLIHGLPGSGVPRASAYFHPREVGATLAMLLPVPIVFLLFGEQRRLRLLAGGAVATGAAVLLLSQALMGLFGLGLALLLIAAWWRRWVWGIALGGLVIGSGLLVAWGPQRWGTVMLSMEHPLGIGVVLRLDMWSRALAMLHDMPLSGIGLNTFALVQPHFYTGFAIGPEVHAHNFFVQTAVDLGLPGLIAFLWIVAAFYRVVMRAYRATQSRELQILLVGLAAGVLAYLGGGLLDTVTLGAKPVAALWVMFGLATAVDNLSSRPATAASHPRKRMIPVIFLVVISLLLMGRPGLWRRNLGTVQAHKALFTVRTTGSLPAAQAQTAVTHLQQALRDDPDNPQLYGTLGSLYAWQGEDEAAVAALRRRIALDIQNPDGRYLPFARLNYRLQGTNPPLPCDSTLRLYTQWQHRYPDRAEFYLLPALVQQQCGKTLSERKGLLQLGLEKKAQPAGVLVYALANLDELD